LHDILDVLKKYLPFNIYIKLIKYCLWENSRSTISWEQCKTQLDSCSNLSECADELLNLLDNLSPQEKNTKTFHINDQLDSPTATEPTHSNTEKLVLDFFTYMYRRNILASVVKYILLNNIINKFTTSLLTPSFKGIFSQILLRLNQIVFECVLLAFNGANYDNYLLCNPLILCLTKLKHKISIFKKGASISTIKCTINRNIQAKPGKKNCEFTSNLYIKDIRYMVSACMSLDQIGQLFNISFKKLAFPYEVAKSIETLKHTISLNPYDEMFWQDNFTGKVVNLQNRINAQDIFEKKNFANLYQFSDYYLRLDCLLLHSIVMTIFKSYLEDSINIFVRRNYSQSNLSFQQLFIVIPSQQITHNLAPKKISHPFLNYFIKKGVTGGLCTAFVHNNINEETVINAHFPYVNLNLDKNAWPNFQHPENLIFDKKAAGIVTLDIRSLYPSASCELVPVNSPLIYTRFTQTDFWNLPKYSPMLNIKSFCAQIQTNGNFSTDRFKLINKPPRFFNKFNAINFYLSTLPSDIKIVRFQSNFTALGQLFFVQYPIDGFLAFTQNNTLYVKLIQYNSNFRHGHLSTCSILNTEEQLCLKEKTNLVKTNITELYLHLIEHFQLSNVEFEYVNLSECQHKNHKIPKIHNFICSFKKDYTYSNFLKNILNKNLTGFVVVKNLEIKNKNPIIGFLIQKVCFEFNRLSPYTQNLLKNFNESERVVSLHKTSSFMVISTFYLLYLYETFGFQNTPDIYHGVFFQFDYYLKDQIEDRLKQRAVIKSQIKMERNILIKQNLEIQSELLKLMLNSCYGFTLCNLNASKFKCFKNAQELPKKKKATKKIKSCVELAPNVYLNEYYNNLAEPFETMLGHCGSNILFFSKIILLKRLHFVFKHLNPCKAQLLYIDTDSAHILLHHKDLIENIDPPLRDNFNLMYQEHFESTAISGIWVTEGFFHQATYIGEKCYIMNNTINNQTLSHMKGLNKMFQLNFVKNEIDRKVYSYIKYNNFEKTKDFLIIKTTMNKDLFSNYLPIKRYFVCASGSLPLKLK